MRRTLRFLLSVSAERVFPSRRFVGGHAIGKGYWYKFHGEDGPAQKADVDKLLAEMQELIKAATPIVKEEKPYSDILAYFKQTSQVIAAQLLERRVPLGGVQKVSLQIFEIRLILSNFVEMV